MRQTLEGIHGVYSVLFDCFYCEKEQKSNSVMREITHVIMERLYDWSNDDLSCIW